MATTATVIAVDQVKGNTGPTGELHAYQVSVQCSGAYATATKPSFDILAALQTFGRQGVSAARVVSVACFRDAFTSAAVRQTAPNANIALSSTGNKVATFRIDAAPSASQQNGTGGGSEVADTTVCDGTFEFLVLAEVTKS